MRVRIVSIGKIDGFYKGTFHDELIGATGDFFPVNGYKPKGGFRGGDFKIDSEYKKYLSESMVIFFRVKVHQLKENENDN